MKILDGIYGFGMGGLWISKQQTLILSDLHMGFEESLEKKGILLPRHQVEDIVTNIQAIRNELPGRRAKKVVLNGDFKHEFGGITRQEWKDSKIVLDLLAEFSDETILVKGNHDTVSSPLQRRHDIKIVEKLEVSTTLILHGDKVPDKISKQVKNIVIGHEHPAITISDSIRSERYKCFLVGKFKGKNLIVTPSLNPLTQGTDVSKEKLLSPFLKGNIDNFRVIVVGDKLYDFGKLGKFGL